MNQQDKKPDYSCEVLNIKGLSWMLKGNSVGTTTNSSHVSTMNQHFKIFKLKDEKKKWKKKTNKKFQGVGLQIQSILKNKLSESMPFDKNFLKIIKPQYVPHLQMIIKDTLNQKQNAKTNKQNLKIINELKQRYTMSELKTKQQMEDQIMKLTQSYQSIKNNGRKIEKIKNIGLIHQRKKQLFEETVNQYFKDEECQTLKKIQKYKQFSIQEYQIKLIQGNIKNSKPFNTQFQNIDQN